jgi:hypothetical protein
MLWCSETAAHFGGAYRLHLHGRRVCQNKKPSYTRLSARFFWFLASLTVRAGKVRQCSSETPGSLLSTQRCSLQAYTLHCTLCITTRNSYEPETSPFSIGAAFTWSLSHTSQLISQTNCMWNCKQFHPILLMGVCHFARLRLF